MAEGGWVELCESAGGFVNAAALEASQH